MSCCGNKTRRPFNRTSGGQPVTQRPVNNDRQPITETARDRITSLRWKK